MASTNYTEQAALEEFDRFTNNGVPTVQIRSYEFLPSDVLKTMDPVAYREEFLNWCDKCCIDIDFPEPTLC